MALNRPQVIASAEKLVSRGKIEAAIKEYRKLLAENPNDASTLNRLGDLYVRVERIDEAVRLFSQIADRYSDDGFFVKAIAIYKKIIKLDPTRLVVYERLAELYHRQGLIPEARTQYQVLVDYYQKHANSTSAIGILERMAALVPDDPGPHVKLAELYHAQKMTDRALAAYRVIADLMLRHSKVEEATQVYMRAIEAEPGDIAFITDAVLGLKDAGHTGAAARLLALAVERNPQAEKIARIAGLGRGAATEPPPPATMKVSDITHPGRTEREILKLDSSLLEPSRPAPPPPLTPPPPSFFPPPRPQPPPVAPPRVEDADVDLVLELPDDLEAPSTLVSPTDEMLRRSPDSPWFEAQSEDGAVEFELEIEGLQELEGIDLESRPVERPAPAPLAPSPAHETEPLAPFELEELSELAPASAPPPAKPVSPASPPPATPKRPSSSEAIASAFGAPIGDGSPEFEIDWSFEPEPDLSIPEIPPLPPLAPPTSPALVPASALNVEELERTSYEVHPAPVSAARRQEDLLAEAEVFRKYGLREKAHDRIRELLQENGRHLGGNALLVTLWIDEGKHDKALARANQVAKLAEESGDELVWPQLRNRLTRAGYTFDGERVATVPTAAPKKKDKITSLLDDLAGHGVSARAPRPAAKEATPAELLASITPPAAPKVAPSQSRPSPIAASAAPPPPSTLHGAIDDELPEIVLPIIPPGTPPAKGGLKIKETPQGYQAVPPGKPAAPQAATPQGIAADESLSWLDQAVAKPAPRKEEEKLFDDEEGFFDLAAELEQELSKDELLKREDLMPAPQEQSLEEIVEGFKRGVAESLSAEDYDTHYNLGIAYREMGLLDEAIGEFQLASKEQRYLVDCCSLLGGCFLEKGLPELAIKWYKRGLESPDLPEEAYLGLLYDLGNVYLFQGDADKARATFVEIYGVNSNYRDVVAKLAELGAHI